MTVDITPELVTRVDAAIRGTAGVRDVYRSGSLVANLVGTSAALLGMRAEDDALIGVAVDGDGVRVDATLGIEYVATAAATLAAVRSAVATALRDEGVALSAIVLTVAYVHPRESAS